MPVCAPGHGEEKCGSRPLFILFQLVFRELYCFCVGWRSWLHKTSCRTYDVSCKYAIRAEQALAAIEDMMHAVVDDDADTVREALERLLGAIKNINVSMDRMFGMCLCNLEWCVLYCMLHLVRVV